MKKTTYLLTWNSGYGTGYAVSDAETHQEAIDEAYEMWKEEAESNSEYEAQELTLELCEEWGIDPEEHGLEATE